MKMFKIMIVYCGADIEIGKVIHNRRGWVYKGNGKKASSKFFKTPEETAKLCRVKHTLEEVPEKVLESALSSDNSSTVIKSAEAIPA